MKMRVNLFLIILTGLCLGAPSFAHHGVASLGAAGLEGPGAPVDSSSSATLPQDSWLAYLKLDQPHFETYTSARDDESERNDFWIYGLGYGFRPWLSGYVFLPYSHKKLEDNSFNTSGFADMSLMGVLGFKYYDGFIWVPERESLDDLEDWHFTVYGGLSLPTGDANIRDSQGNIDPGMSLGFGKPTYTLGLTATKQWGATTLTLETSYLHFMDYEYDDGNSGQFGGETRFNLALSQRFFAREKLRVDGVLEANYLHLGRDKTNGEAETATGGAMIYLLPGLRLYYKNLSLGFGVKIPTWTDLNEEAEQQGAEGKEDYRLLTTFSVLF